MLARVRVKRGLAQGGWRRRLANWGQALFLGGKRVAVGLYQHDCLGLAAQVAYSALFSVFPFLLFVRAVTAYIPGAEKVSDWLLAGLRDLVSQDSRLYQIVEESVFTELGATSVSLLSVGAVLTLWVASGAVMVLIKAINQAYGLPETRPWHKRRVMAVGLSAAGAVLLPVGMLFLVFGSWVGEQISQHFGENSAVHTLWLGLRWPAVFLLLVAVVAALFYLAPSARQRWYAVFPGALFSVGAFIGVSIGLSWFLSQNMFQVRWLTYGVIGTAIVLVFWAFLAGLVMLIGGEINAAVRAAREGDPETEGLLESGRDERDTGSHPR